MQLTSYTDYALRLLLYAAVQPGQKLSSVKEVSQAYNISYNHLTKVTQELGRHGLLETVKGRGGGFRLAVSPEQVTVGEVVRLTEDNSQYVECFDDENNACILSPSCRLKGVLNEALQAYLAVLDRYTLADITVNGNILRELLGMKEGQKR
ncbi:RrF2 family transcriptional regulator [Alteribacter natronophilus]|uniref:RrF2 family transcriptional regulator n=1 Tax=Alteribacter natronophilus TaxID=2583810 RepID=UPI00110E2AFE|nr:Rrf2 family transcriptional regulator [Alteribacter natronophilus]TMW71793.1 Rrf2 family transcriptional regulator [Alteribacter natronophilus]